MKIKWNIIYLMTAIIMAFGLLVSAQTTRQYTLTVEVHHLRNEKGMVQFALYNQDGTLPDQKYQKAYKIGRSAIKDHSSKYEFTGLPPGMYAVNVLHDENNNRAIDKGLLKPLEGIGFSNYSTVGFANRPNFLKAMFEVTSDRSIEVKVIYF